MQTTLKFYNQSVGIQTRDDRLIKKIEQFLDQYYTVNQKGFGANSESTFSKIYASVVSDYNTVVVHRNQFTHFLHWLQLRNEVLENYRTEDHRAYEVTKEDYVIRPKWQLREDQKPVNDFLKDNPVKSKLVPLATGSGKAQPLDALVKVPDGWVTMGSLSVGDTVIAYDGTKTKVNGVFPQGVKPVYRLTFSDGRSCEASDEHLWKTVSPFENIYKTTELKTLIENEGYDVYIDLCEPETKPDKEIPYDPTLVGRYNPEQISEYFLEASYEQKLAVLKAFFSVNREELTKELAETIQYLVRSIGGVARVVNTGMGYRVDYQHHALNLTKNCKRIQLIHVEYVGEKECQCISIEHPEHLYITNDFIVTHNTLIALYTLGELKDRIGIVVLPQFIDKWISDILEIHDTDGKEIMLIQGSKSLAGIITMTKEGRISNKYFLFSSRTMQDFISMYEQTPDQCVEMYGASPLEVFPLLGIGVLLIDETHMAFHAIFKTIINTNVKYQIGLSGTLISEDVVVSRVHRVVYPKSSTYHDTMQKRYMDIYAIAYGINPILIQTKRIKTVNYGSTFYSHIAFEKSILKEKRFMSDYYRIIKGVIEDYYIPDYDKRDSLIIYVTTINMADTVLGMLKRDYPGKDIVRYCDADDYDTMLKAEIVVTTPQSLSTGIDKPNLRVVIQTVSISSEVTNVQSAGRLRDLKDRDTKFCYIYSDNIQKQREYHKKREQMFAHRCKTFSLRRSRFSIS